MADNTISEQQKLLAERNKLDKESNQARIEANREFEKATLESNDNFKKMVTKLREVQPETAKIVADFKVSHNIRKCSVVTIICVFN